MTPVEETSTESSGQPSASAADSGHFNGANFSLQAGAGVGNPALTRIALALRFSRCSRQTSTGAAQKEFGVKTPEAAHPRGFSTVDQTPGQACRNSASGFNRGCREPGTTKRTSTYRGIFCIFFRFHRDRGHFCQPFRLFLPPEFLQPLPEDRNTWAGLPVPSASPGPAPHADLNVEEHADGLILDSVDHLLEHFVAFALIGDERVLLPVAAKADALLQVIHIEEVVFPERIDGLEENIVFEVPHERFAEFFFPCFIAFPHQVQEVLAKLLPVTSSRDSAVKSSEFRISG